MVVNGRLVGWISVDNHNALAHRLHFGATECSLEPALMKLMRCEELKDFRG